MVNCDTIEYMYIQYEHNRRVMPITYAKTVYYNHVEKLSVQE